MREYSAIGKRISKVDALTKALGEAKYAIDIYLPGMLHGKVLRSPHPHARILRIDTEKAKRLRGVKVVITAQDVPDIRYGNWVVDMGILAREKVPYIGEPIAAVAAVDEDTASEALELISVEYDRLIFPLPASQRCLPWMPGNRSVKRLMSPSEHCGRSFKDIGIVAAKSGKWLGLPWVPKE